jgi:hypothetical protein
VLRFKFSALFCQLSLNMLGRQQRLILLVEKYQQVLKMNAREKDYGSYGKFEELRYSLPTISP